MDPQLLASSLADRLSRLTPETERRWGTLTPHEMMCHLSDSFLAMLGERSVSARGWSPMRQRFTRWIALHTPLPWPKEVPTMPEVDPRQRGTKPDRFDADRARLAGVMHRFLAPDARYAAHPMFGVMSRTEWMTWTFRHVDHHLRQFGL